MNWLWRNILKKVTWWVLRFKTFLETGLFLYIPAVWSMERYLFHWELNKCNTWLLSTFYLKLSQGYLLKTSPSLIKRQKTHFHNLPCGASVIIGNNGFIWICPTINEDLAGGFVQNLEVNNIHGGLLGFNIDKY